MGDELTRPAEKLRNSAVEYIDLKIDDLKLQTVKGLSLSLHKVLLAVFFITIGNIVLIAAAFGMVLLIGKMLDDYAAGAFIVSGFFLIVLAVLFLFRKKLFIKGLVNTFMQLFFDGKQ